MSGTPIGKVRLLLLEDGQGQTEKVRELMHGEDMDLSVASQDIDEALQQVRTVSPDVILVALTGKSLIESIERLDAVSGGNPIVALLTPEQFPSSRDVLLAGARAYLPLDTTRGEIVDTITNVLERERRRRAALARQLGVEIDLGQIVAVHGSKGGVGATSISVNLAVAIKRSTHKRVALVDANLYSGDVAASLNLMSRSSLADLTPHLKELDEEFLGRASVGHASGIRAFLAPDDFVRAQMINGEQISRILKVMRQYFDYIVVDTCSLPDQVTSAALDEANRILLVTTPEVPALKNAARFYRLADEFGYRSKIALVLNRARSRGAIGLADIEEHLHSRVAVTIHSDGGTVPTAINAGEPVIYRRRSRFTAGIWQLTSMLTGVSTRKLVHANDQADEDGTPTNGTPVPVHKFDLARESASAVVADSSFTQTVAPVRNLFTRIRPGR